MSVLCPSIKSSHLAKHIMTSMTFGYEDFIVFFFYLTPLPPLRRLHSVMGYAYIYIFQLYIRDIEESREIHYFGQLAHGSEMQTGAYRKQTGALTAQQRGHIFGGEHKLLGRIIFWSYIL
jgi:hypothetical protein